MRRIKSVEEVIKKSVSTWRYVSIKDLESHIITMTEGCRYTIREEDREKLIIVYEKTIEVKEIKRIRIELLYGQEEEIRKIVESFGDILIEEGKCHYGGCDVPDLFFKVEFVEDYPNKIDDYRKLFYKIKRYDNENSLSWV